MYNRIVKGSVFSETISDTINVKTSTSKQAVKTAIIATETTNDTLQLSTIKSPNCTMFVQITFKCLCRCTTKRIEKFSTSTVVDKDSNPMFSRIRRNVRVGHKKARFGWQSIDTEHALKNLLTLTITVQKSVDLVSVHNQLLKSNTTLRLRSISMMFSNSA